MTQSLSSSEKLEKLIKVCLYKRWTCQTFIRFCGQLQETCDFDSSSSIGDALFSVVKGGPLEPLFLEYICMLASDPKSLFPLSNLIEYLKDSSNTDSRAKSDVLIFVSKSLGSWNNPGISSMITQLGKILAEYMNKLLTMSKEEKQLLLESKAIGYFLIKLCESGLATVLIMYEDSKKSNQFQIALRKVYNQKIIGKADPFLEKQLKSSYKSILDQSGEDENNTNDTEELKLTGISIKSSSSNSRAYRLLWLESLMLTASKIQGNTFIRELNIFFAGENSQSIVSKLITTSFDCLAVALQRKDSPIYIPLWKGFIGKRLPLIIRRLQTGNNDSYPFEPAICRSITLLDRGTVNLLRVYGGGDALDEMFSSFPSTTSDIRHEFLKACIDMGLIRPESLQQTLAEDANVVEDNTDPSYGPPRTNYLLRKDGITQVGIEEIFKISEKENPEHVAYDDSTIVWLVNSFDNIDGYRQEKIAKSLVKFVEEWVNNHKTGSLGRVCQALNLNTDTLDILFLHITPTSLLIPLIKLLDDWKDDEDENDFQEVYAHFGTVFLFIEVVYRRYALSKDDLIEKIEEEQLEEEKEKSLLNSFWLNCITGGVRAAIMIDDMSEDRKSLLGGWISALYDAGGISDDLMRLSSIQELIILVPSVFQQSITACAAEIIDQDTLKGGLDYFLQPFLLPTLLGAFRYLSDCLWLSNNVVQVLWVLNLLISPSGLSSEASNIHKVVLSIVANDVKSALTDLKSRITNEHGTIDQLLIALEPHAASAGRFAPNIPITSSLVSTMKDTINILVGWIQELDQGHISGAPSYVLRCFSLAIDILGARRLLDLFLDELDFAEPQGSFEYAMDVISGIIMIMDTLGQHDRRGISTQIDSSLVQLIGSISEESVIQQRAKKRRDHTNGNSTASTANNGTMSSASTGTKTDLLIGTFRKLKARIESLQDFRKQQEKLLPIEEELEEDEPTDEIMDAVNLGLDGGDMELSNEDISSVLLPTIAPNGQVPIPVMSSSSAMDTNDMIDPNSDVVDTDGLGDMGLMADLDMGIGDDDLALGAGLDMSGFDTDEQLMMMDLT